VITSLSSKTDPASQSLCALAQHTLGQPSGLYTAEKLASDPIASEDPTVQLCSGTILSSPSTYESAITLLSKHQGSLEAVLLLTHLHLQSNRLDLATREVAAAKRWAQDSLLINLAEAWVNLRTGGEKYQAAFYVFEELAATDQSGGSSSVGQAVSEILMGRGEEAEVGLKNVMGREGGGGTEALANSVVLAHLMGRGEEGDKLMGRLGEVDPHHPLVVGCREKSEMFDEAAKKYSAKLAAAA
jgi:coatomer protein complex subunit epsilon